VSVFSEIPRMVVEGGPFLYVIAAVFVAGCAIAVERALAIEAARRVDARDLPGRVVSRLEAGELREAYALCEPRTALVAGALADVLAHAAAPYEPGLEARLRERADHRVSLASAALEKRLDFLPASANVATMLGLLGTVTALVAAFGAGAVGASVGAVSRALYPTVFGIGAAIPLFLAQSILASRLDSAVIDARNAADRVVAAVISQARADRKAERARAAEQASRAHARERDRERDPEPAPALDREVSHRHGSLLAR